MVLCLHLLLYFMQLAVVAVVRIVQLLRRAVHREAVAQVQLTVRVRLVFLGKAILAAPVLQMVLLM
jgi:hypothetical protein